MREVGVGGQFHFFGVDHDQFDFVRFGGHKDGHDDRVDADRFSRSCGPGDDAVRHFCQVAHHIVAVDSFAKKDGDVELLSCLLIGDEHFFE